MGLFGALDTFAKPRPPLPPWPEGQLAQWRFDLTNKVEDNVLDTQGYTLGESWSGYAMQMSGASPRRWVVSTFKDNGRPQVTSGVGTIRFWFAPYWTSQSTNGSGPGAWARLIEIGRADGTGFWLSLAADPSGNQLKLSSRVQGVPTTLIEAPIQWTSNQWQHIALVYGTNGLQIIVDGNVIGSTAIVPLWPSVSDWPQYLLSVGSGFQGQELAQGEIDEVTTFGGPVSAEYLAWQYGKTAPIAMLGPIVEGDLENGEMMMMSSPPPPGGGGGGGVYGTNGPPPGLVTEPGLKLTVPRIIGSVLSTSLKEADTNSAYEIFHRLTISSTSKWVRAASGDLGQTNFSVTVPSTNTAFYQAAEIFDSDFDGLSDAYERWVSGTSLTVPDSNGNGIPDGQDDANGNGIPDYIDYAGLNRAVIWASRPSAFEGALSGELTIQLPTPAPTNNTLVTLHLSPNVDYDGDYYLTRQDTGARVTNDMFFAAGQTQQKILVHAINDTDQASTPRKLQAKLASSANYQLDWEMAEVTLVDNDIPRVWILASDPEAKESGGINDQGMFVLKREGSTAGTLSVSLNRSGSVSNGIDCVAVTNLVVFPTNISTVNLPVISISDTNYEGDETLVLTIQPAPSVYVIHTNGQSATVKIPDDDLPVVYFAETNLFATEYGTSATIRVRRTGSTAQALVVPLAIAGTATNGTDYATNHGTVTIAAGSSEGTSVISPINNPYEEQVETAIFSIKGSLEYEISTNANSCTVQIDDNSPHRLQMFQLKVSAAYQSGVVDSPSVFEIRRYGRSANATNLPFQVRTNISGGHQLTTFYFAGGNISGNNITFAPYAASARLTIRPPQNVSAAGGAVWAYIPTVSEDQWTTWYQPAYTYVKLEVVNSNVVEGVTGQGRIRLSRPVAGPAVSLDVHLSGKAVPGQDHDLAGTVTMTIPTSQFSADVTYTALSQGGLEGWESVVFSWVPLTILTVAEFHSPHMAFIRDNVTAPEFQSDIDTDNDGLPDRWEIANEFDPFTAGEANLDSDKDGLTNADELKVGTNPKKRDTDGNGELDLVESVRDLSKDDNYVELRLRTRDSGKTADGVGCAVCHTTVLKVGGFSHYSATRNYAEERSIFLKKGTNYPIHLADLFRDLPPPVGGTSPTNSAKYDAEILAPTNTPRAFVVSGAQTNKLGVNKDFITFFPTDPTIPIGTVTVARIEVLWTNVPGNVPLDTNINIGGGLRVFPDRLHWTDTTPRNTVRVRVTTIPPLPAGQRVLLKSFDVDDPMYPSDADIDNIVDTNDVGTVKGDDNRGTPKPGILASTVVTLGANGEAITDLAVTMQPGDNFRVAAVLDTPAAQAHLDKLQVTNSAAPFYISAGSNSVSGFVGGTSPMLTIWRKLHLEFDSMVAPPASGFEAGHVTATITAVRLNQPVTGRSLINLNYQSINIDDNPGIYGRGKLEIPGVGTFKATTNTWTIVGAIGRTTTIVELDAVPTGIQVGSTVKLYDDDDQFLRNDGTYLSQLTLQSPPLPMHDRSVEFITNIQSRYSAAYIQLVSANTNGWNNQPTIPFYRQAPIGGIFDSGNQQLKGTDQPGFWAYTVIFAYEPHFLEDGDPNTEAPLRGITQEVEPLLLSFHGYSVVYVETVRDSVFSLGRGYNFLDSQFNTLSLTNTITRAYLNRLYGTTAHEIGHAPGGQLQGADHAEGGLMGTGGEPIDNTPFLPPTIRRFRNATKWLP